jgi:hypothetical protein
MMLQMQICRYVTSESGIYPNPDYDCQVFVNVYFPHIWMGSRSIQIWSPSQSGLECPYVPHWVNPNPDWDYPNL